MHYIKYKSKEKKLIDFKVIYCNKLVKQFKYIYIQVIKSLVLFKTKLI